VNAKGKSAGRGSRWRSPTAYPTQTDASVSSAGVALALVYPLVARARKRLGATQGVESMPAGEGANGMRRTPSIHSLETVTAEEAAAYLEQSGGDELSAACAVAWDRNRLDGSIVPPDEPEIHHALFLLCLARGKKPPSFDTMRVELRRRVAAA